MDKLELFLTEKKITEIVSQLADTISASYPTNTELLVVVTLKGALFFASDLIRKLKQPVQIDFVRLSSYSTGTQSQGTVRFLKDIEVAPEGRHILILDEIVDSGRSLAFLHDRLKDTGAASLKMCTLLDKPSRRQVPVTVDFVGMKVEDKFLVGYGLDFNEKYRNLPNIYCVG